MQIKSSFNLFKLINVKKLQPAHCIRWVKIRFCCNLLCSLHTLINLFLDHLPSLVIMVVSDDDIVTHILVSELNTMRWKFFNSTFLWIFIIVWLGRCVWKIILWIMNMNQTFGQGSKKQQIILHKIYNINSMKYLMNEICI